MQDIAQTLRDTNTISLEFLNVELDTGLLFAEIAAGSNNAEKTARNRANARIAYDTVLRFIGSVSMTDAESESLGLKMATLKRDLQALGESF